MSQNNPVQELSIGKLFNNQNDNQKNEFYSIPSYQRNYAWGEKEIEQLIQDIIDKIKLGDNKESLESKSNTNNTNNKYYIGTLVTYLRKDGVYEVIDGQQRLTTLNLLKSAMIHYDFLSEKSYNNKNTLPLILKFDSRKQSTINLEQIWSSGNTSNDCALSDGYKLCKKILSEKLKQDSEAVKKDIMIDNFRDFLNEKVTIMRVVVPKDTDLNHYFEIMNNRGEQLEKHEILKAKFMSKLDSSDKYVFAKIWDACSNMDRYVQMCFNTDVRSKIFGDSWNEFKFGNYNDLFNSELSTSIKKSDGTNSDSVNDIRTIMTTSPKEINHDEKISVESAVGAPENTRFRSVVDFPIFLLHVLRVMVNKNFASQNYEKKDISLDDKRLIESFNGIFKYDDQDRDRIKEFAYELLRAKFLFDKYIIKREPSKSIDGWELQSFKKTNDKSSSSYPNTFDSSDADREITLLLSMFHVSIPSMNYKYWLDGVMLFLMKNGNNDISSDIYVKYLQNLAKKFVYGRYLSNNPMEYYGLIYKDDSLADMGTLIDENLLNYGSIRNNLVFNYIDYLIYKTDVNLILDNKLSFYKNYKDNFENCKKNFVFTFRSSVEHYFPQNPDENTGQIRTDKIKKCVDTFGNLCLVTHATNSSLGNHGAVTKREKYEKKHVIDKKPDSLKQYIMMSYANWDVDEIEDHNKKMIQLLKINCSRND